MTPLASGVLPDEVIRDPRSDAELTYVTLADGLTPEQIQTFLRALTDAVDRLNAGEGAERAATTCVGLGRRFFARAGIAPVSLAVPAAEPPGAVLDVDLIIYTMCREEWRLADFRRVLAQCGAGIVTAIQIDRGHQRPTARELGGFLDGLRNAGPDREAVVFVDRDRDPEEPEAAAGGTYMVTMRIIQNLDAWEALGDPEQEQIIGRRKVDGSRLDLPEGTTPETESGIGAGCPLSSHVAKSGPRGTHRDQVQIFRRGVPFLDLRPDGSAEGGLLFVSFQASMSQFDTIFGEWMINPEFPAPGTGRDALLERGHIQIANVGYFFVPAPAEYIGARFLSPAPGPDDRCLGRVAVRKRLVDASDSPIRAERGGFGFQLFGDDGSTIGEPFLTDSTGRALSPAVPVGDTYTLREVVTPAGFDTAPDQLIELNHRRLRVDVVNKATAVNPGYGG
jgi:Dyp-type peroxidase family